MLRTMDERDARQRALKQQNEERPAGDYMTLGDCAREMKVSYGTARRLFRWEPDVKLVRTRDSQRPIIRVPREVFERVMRRSANPWS